MAITRHATKLAGLIPDDPLQALAVDIDMIPETLSDLQAPIRDIMSIIKDEEFRIEKTKLHVAET